MKLVSLTQTGAVGAALIAAREAGHNLHIDYNANYTPLFFRNKE